jgi:hypothetical protein
LKKQKKRKKRRKKRPNPDTEEQKGIDADKEEFTEDVKTMKIQAEF